MTWPAHASSFVFIALALAVLALCGLLLRAGQRRVIAAVGFLAAAAFFIGFLLWELKVIDIPFVALFPLLMFSLIATFIALAVLRPELRLVRYAGQWVALGIGTLIACVGALPDLLGASRAIQGALIVAGFYVMVRVPGVIGRFLALRGRPVRWWSPDDGLDLVLYLILIAAMTMPSQSLSMLMAGSAALLLAYQLLRRRR